MNIYQRLNNAREEFHSLQLKKTGHNKFANYYYFELGDFLIPALACFKRNGLCAVISFGQDVAEMQIVAEDGGGMISITSPMSTAELKGCHSVQNLGAVQTYLRRYLWVAALEIVEHDAIDATSHKKNTRHSPVPDVQLDKETVKRLDEVINDLLAAWAHGLELEVLDIARKVTDQDEKLYIWKKLQPESKLRAFLKANKV